MVTHVRDAGAVTVGQFVPPYGGTWNSLAANLLTPDKLYDSLNVFLREGKLRDRPGYRLLNETIFNNPVIGGSIVVTPTTKIMLAITATDLYRLDTLPNNWRIDTTDNFAATDGDNIEITFLETASQYVGVIAAPGRQLKRWIDGLGAETIVAASGTTPIAVSVCTAGSRIVALVDSHTVVWTDILTYDKFGALNYNKKGAETNDEGICVRNLGSLDFVLYKERSIYLAKSAAGSDARAFTMQLVQRVEGPASAKAVVDINGAHVYLTATGRVGYFDGTSYVRWIADGLWLFLQKDIDPRYLDRIAGIFDYRLHLIIFHYPRRGDDGNARGMIIINVPFEGGGLTTFAAFLGASTQAISHGFEMRFKQEISQTVLFNRSGNVSRSLILDEFLDTDLDMPFECVIQTGLLPMPDMKHHQVHLELFLERDINNGAVNVYLVTSDMLENRGGTVELLAQTVIDLGMNSANEYIGFNIPTRFAGFKLTWSSESTVVYLGGVMYGRKVG